MTRPITADFHYLMPSWAKGCITRNDAAFLAGMVEEAAPDAVAEIGVASGCSSAVLLHALAGVHGQPDPAKPWLYSFDLFEHCYFDPSRRVGEAVDEQAPELRSAWRLTIEQSLGARRVLDGRELPFAFVDAEHRHPWPTFDLLALLPMLREGAWVVLHDIRLSELSSEPGFRAHGAEYLFNEWPWTKRVEPIDRNIGAIRLDAPREEIIEYCLRLLRKPWQLYPPLDVRLALDLPEPFRYQAAHVLEAVITLNRAMRATADGPRRPLILWSAGQAGREGIELLRDGGIHVDGIVDRDVRKHGQPFEGLTVADPRSLRASDHPRPFVVACGLYSVEIANDLQQRGFVMDDDFVALVKCD